MSPTLIPGDYILVSKMSYGARLLNVKKFKKEGIVEYIRTKGWSNIKKGDVFVFNWPDYSSLKNKNPNIYGNFVVKRCFGCPGDTINIHVITKENEIVETSGEANNLFPFDKTLHWTVSNYGPLFVPGKGKTIVLDSLIAFHYKDVLLYEGMHSEIRNDSVFLNKIFYKKYTFKCNYYFMKGDNFYGSMDSRYWGFVPEDNIVGKAVMIMFSKDPDENSFLKLKINRLFHYIK